MRRSTCLFTGLALIAVLAACQKGVPEVTQSDRDAVKAQIDQYVRFAAANDWDAWGATLSTDVWYSPPNLAPMKGRDAVVAWAKTLPKTTSLTPTVDDISGRGDVTYARGSYTLSVTLPDGSPMTEHGAYLGIHRRQPDGTWPYTHVIYHSTDPLPGPPVATKK